MITAPSICCSEAQKVLKWGSKVPLSSLDPVKARESIPYPFPSQTSIETVRNVECNGVNCRFYCPTRSNDTLIGMTIYLHPGGWVLGGLDMTDHACRCLAKKSGHAVISVDYGLAPENPYPGPLDDCISVCRFVYENAKILFGCDNTRISIMGESAGGNLAAGVVNHSGLQFKLQVLLYPVTDCSAFALSSSVVEEGSSYKMYGSEDFGLSFNTMSWMYKHYVHNSGNEFETEFEFKSESESQSHYIAMAKDGKISPLLEEDKVLMNAPPTLIITAECDILRDQGEKYAEKLRSLGVETSLKCYSGQIHGFYLYLLSMKDARDALDYVATSISNAFDSENNEPTV